MSIKTNTLTAGRPTKIWPKKILDRSIEVWFTVAVLGQWIFALYVALFYGGAAMDGDFMRWNRVLPHGYVEGETMGNTAVAIHLLFAVIVMVGGPMQFIPKLRNYFPRLHRWNGRFYIGAAFLISLSGIYMVITKGTISGLVGDISVSLNGALILVFALMAIRTAMKRDFVVHRKWALRLFLTMAGVWFFRIGLMFWLFVHGRPVGFDPETFRGPFLVFLGFAQYLLPLAVLELYFLAQKNKSGGAKIAMSMGMIILTLITALGTFAATMGMWIPRIS
ncbi:DUF2306 domain-containing protein [Flagellimonas algicola]|uniref:DUF2306 domain-containing protein n=1 Tax=Flagellimonas algicola TaxID=2583815 RepID=A0ABY2WPR8_9FLAO|nr:DUF2306 domain-containing protein [Allomuricauda algicola]TMU56918.1 DUF2306 domain-containing protein [Allomuricauda algicola]